MNRRTPSSSSRRLIWWLIAVCVTFSSDAAWVKLKCRAAASNARNPFSDGSLAVIPRSPKYMSLYHPKRYKVSFVNSPISADISSSRLLQEPKMSTFTHKSMINHHEPGILSQVAETLHVWRQRYRVTPRTGELVRSGTPRRRHLLERCRLRGRKAVLAGLNRSQAGVASSGGRRPSFGTDGSAR